MKRKIKTATKEKRLIGYVSKDWRKSFCFKRNAMIASVPNLVRYPKNKFFFSQYRRIKVSIIIKPI